MCIRDRRERERRCYDMNFKIRVIHEAKHTNKICRLLKGSVFLNVMYDVGEKMKKRLRVPVHEERTQKV